jgi:hypothetical protein
MLPLDRHRDETRLGHRFGQLQLWSQHGRAYTFLEDDNLHAVRHDGMLCGTLCR